VRHQVLAGLRDAADRIRDGPRNRDARQARQARHQAYIHRAWCEWDAWGADRRGIARPPEDTVRERRWCVADNRSALKRVCDQRWAFRAECRQPPGFQWLVPAEERPRWEPYRPGAAQSGASRRGGPASPEAAKGYAYARQTAAKADERPQAWRLGCGPLCWPRQPQGSRPRQLPVFLPGVLPWRKPQEPQRTPPASRPALQPLPEERPEQQPEPTRPRQQLERPQPEQVRWARPAEPQQRRQELQGPVPARQQPQAAQPRPRVALPLPVSEAEPKLPPDEPPRVCPEEPARQPDLPGDAKRWLGPAAEQRWEELAGAAGRSCAVPAGLAPAGELQQTRQEARDERQRR